MALVSIIVPIYNREKTLGECLSSVINQYYEDWECVVVDDCSTDSSLEIARSLAKVDQRIRVVSSDKNRGPSAARNIGIKLALGRYLVFLDSDDKLESMFISSRILNFRCGKYNGEKNVVLYGQTAFFSGPIVFGYSGNSFNKLRRIEECLVKGNPFCIEALLIEKECIERVGLFDEGLKRMEDLDLWFRLGLLDIEFYPSLCLGEDRALCRQHDGRISSDKRYMMIYEIKMREKWASYEAVLNNSYLRFENSKRLNSRRLRVAIHFAISGSERKFMFYLLRVVREKGFVWSGFYFILNLVGSFLKREY